MFTEIPLDHLLQLDAKECVMTIHARVLTGRRGHYVVNLHSILKGKPRTLAFHELDELFEGPRRYFSLAHALDEVAQFLTVNHQPVTVDWRLMKIQPLEQLTDAYRH